MWRNSSLKGTGNGTRSRSGGVRLIRRVVGIVIISAFGIGPVVVINATNASAHTGVLRAVPTCESNGTYSVAYSGTTSKVPASGAGHTATFRVGEVTPTTGTTISGAPSTVVGNAAYSFTQAGVPGTAKSASATAFLVWGDGVKADPIGGVKLAGDCKPTPKVVTPQSPKVTTPTCSNPNIVVTPVATVGVIWAPAGPTTLKPGQTVTYRAAAAKAFQLPNDDTPQVWTFKNTFNPATCTIVTPPVVKPPVVVPPVVKPPVVVPPVVDVCVNLKDAQAVVPAGMLLNKGICFVPTRKVVTKTVVNKPQLGPVANTGVLYAPQAQTNNAGRIAALAIGSLGLGWVFRRRIVLVLTRQH